MKISNAVLVLFAIGVISAGGLQAQTPPSATAGQTTVPPPMDYQVVQQDANSRVWQREAYENGPNGEVLTNVQTYTELASGLNHLVNGKYVPSTEEIDILPDGTAAATNGQHQAFWPSDILNGEIELVTPGGVHLKSQPAALAYDDGSNTVLIAVLTNSIGQIMGDNQVIYTNAFAGLDADILFTYTRSGFEQDIVVRSQPPSPESLGLIAANTRLQVLSEFFSPPQPTETTNTLPEQAGLALTDTALDFGLMQMVQGKAFILGETTPSACVAKSWVTAEGRQFLVEEVPLGALANELDSLPPTATQASITTSIRGIAKKLVLPPQHFVGRNNRPMKLTALDLKQKPGVVMDYVILNSSLTNYTFLSYTNYFVSGAVNLFGTNIFEGGTVIKFTNSAASGISVNGGIECETGPYKMAIFTSMNDNSVGSEIGGSSGTPTNGPATYLNIYSDGINDLQYLRFAYAGTAIEANDENIWNSQFVHCNNGLMISYNVSVYNTLFSGCNGAIDPIYSSGTIVAENLTVDGSFVEGYVANVDVTNCIVFAGASAVSLHSSNNYQEYNLPTPGFSVLSPFPPFQSVGAGDYYLTDGSNCHGGGTTNINPVLSAELRQKTTYPPMIYSNLTVYAPTTLAPQAQRDNTGSLDAGYHYDPVDYCVDDFYVTNALLTINAGTVIAFDNSLDGIWLQDNSSISSVGTPLAPNWFVHYTCAQEQPVLIGTNGSSGFYSGLFMQTYFYNNPVQNATFQFSKFAIPAGALGYYFYDTSSWTLQDLLLQNCEFFNNKTKFDAAGSSKSATVQIENNLFNGSSVSSVSAVTTNCSLCYSNNLFFDAALTFNGAANSNRWYFFNNDFDTSTLTTGTGIFTNCYNAFLNCTGQLNPTNSTDIFSSNSLAYQTSLFGTFYQPTNSPLLHNGSTTANLAGMYHYTTTTNQVPETNSVVSIGYHYVAATTNGLPLDTNGDGIPDYVEDALGNGLDNSGEIGWNLTNDLGLTVIISQPRNGSTLP